MHQSSKTVGLLSLSGFHREKAKLVTTLKSVNPNDEKPQKLKCSFPRLSVIWIKTETSQGPGEGAERLGRGCLEGDDYLCACSSIHLSRKSTPC